MGGEPPRFITPITSIDADEGERVTFETIVTGTPSPIIQWFRENDEITTSLDFQVLQLKSCGSREGSMRRVLTCSYKCWYICQCEFKMIKSYIRTFGVCTLLEPVSLLKYVSYLGRLTHVIWVIVFLQIINEGDTHKLIIPEVFPEDSGLFVCKATNDYGIAECTAELYMLSLGLLRLLCCLSLVDCCMCVVVFFFFFSSRRRHTRSLCDWSSDVCSSDLVAAAPHFFYCPVFVAAAPRFLYCPFLVAAAPRFLY